ncbi:type-F conjugative transfer system mating-pair stabilization protein TraN [Vibrio parahaemolyticus]|uniref:Type-F conjugative transfer system mating-pair stabilization protein TraN n=1 Tax=Vibrio parahaemolyticus TaxID=670 RepID=A0A9Q3UHR4_VIBPH|nr:type-F conjugative transfer system mating-pair stabilization protein TraN [Vibrio parahaemolyticus]EGR7950935.1 type-F conjugative transfer system mating-pair stabilization protein TraN [Vibrio vulnificus]EGQ8101817.1 type-F conjugative transfer system mating-pair stabilization protein TraN [Vibrio parahaemolyticus]EGQ8550972.1 type-F conjugative transfer system mating-pair stabilization protein TraN [Vibrio parahaemolyticus]EGQ8923923.1 type-F conjugative transfer system mating-pair stabili
MRVMIKFCLMSIVFIPAFASNLTIAEQEKQYQDNLGWAQSAQQGITNKASGQLNVADYCEGTQCTNQIHNPPQKGLNDSAINSQKTSEFYSNDTAGAMQENFDKGRPDVKTDPAYQYALLDQENAYEITHGISNTYVDCDSGSQCIIEHIPKQCNRPTNNNVPCTKVPVATVVTGNVSYRCPSGWTRQGVQCVRTIRQCRYDGRNYVSQSGGNSNCSSGGTSYLWNGNWVSQNQGFTMGALKHSTSWGACKGTNWNKKYEICGPVRQTINATRHCSNGFTLSGGNCIKNNITWRTQCTLMNSCTVTSQQCIEGRATRTINGIPTTLNCWKYQVNHRCSVPDTCSTLASDCETISSSCSLMQNGVCVEQELQKSCPEKNCSTTNLQCLDTTFCLDGDCYNGTPTQSQDFNESAAGLAALSEAAEGLGDPPLIFTGKGMQCTDKAFGFADCCKDGGWGTGIGLAECSEEEEALGQAKEQGITIALGEYCASKVLGVCTRKKKGYCVYDNKLARIVQEQGVKGQLGINLGSAKDPLCEPITPEQLQQINFEHIDFSDFYQDMHDNTNLPSATEIQDRLQSAYGQ